MFTEGELRELLEYKSEHPVLSVYLNTDPTASSADAYKLRLRSMLKEVDLKADAEAVELFFEHEYDWSGRSVAVFSCEPDDFFRSYPLVFPVRDRVRIDHRPHVKPLADLLIPTADMGLRWLTSKELDCSIFILGNCASRKACWVNLSGGPSEAEGRRRRGGAAEPRDRPITQRKSPTAISKIRRISRPNFSRRTTSAESLSAGLKITFHFFAANCPNHGRV